MGRRVTSAAKISLPRWFLFLFVTIALALTTRTLWSEEQSSTEGNSRETYKLEGKRAAVAELKRLARVTKDAVGALGPPLQSIGNDNRGFKTAIGNE